MINTWSALGQSVYSQGLSELKLEKSPFNPGGSCEAPELPANIVKKTGLQEDKGVRQKWRDKKLSQHVYC